MVSIQANLALLLMLAAAASGCSGAPPPAADAASDDLAGSQTSSIAADADPTPASPESTVTILYANGTIDAGVSLFGPSLVGAGDFGDLDLPIDANTTLVFVNLSWFSPGGAQDLDPLVTFPGCYVTPDGCTAHGVLGPLDPGGETSNTAGGPGAPDSPASLVLDENTIQAHLACNSSNPSFCSWTARPSSHTPVRVQVTYSMRIEIHQRAA